MTYAQAFDSRRRLSLLFALWVAPGYRLPHRAWRDALAEQYGIDAALRQVVEDGRWLAETGLVALDEVAVTLTDAGFDVVLGRDQAAGVRRPDPGEIAALNTLASKAGTGEGRS